MVISLTCGLNTAKQRLIMESFKETEYIVCPPFPSFSGGISIEKSLRAIREFLTITQIFVKD